MKVWKMISFANQNENVFFGVGDKPRNAQRKNKVSKKLFKSMKTIYIYINYIYISWSHGISTAREKRFPTPNWIWQFERHTMKQ